MTRKVKINLDEISDCAKNHMGKRHSKQIRNQDKRYKLSCGYEEETLRDVLDKYEFNQCQTSIFILFVGKKS